MVPATGVESTATVRSPAMRKLADDLWLLDEVPPSVLNVYLAGDVLIDSASRHSGRRILRQLGDRTVSAHCLTHAHPDHLGSSHEVCTKLGVPMWCGHADADAAESGLKPDPDTFAYRTSLFLFGGPPHPVARRLREGDQVAGFQVLEVPGHSVGHIAFWREADRTLIAGDVLFNISMRTGLPKLSEPPRGFTRDPLRNRESIRRLAALRPELICVGHGRPVRDGAELQALAARLPRA
jgi:hydroxyacylglutathione hydrolase